MEDSVERPVSPSDRGEPGEKRSGEFDDTVPRKSDEDVVDASPA